MRTKFKTNDKELQDGNLRTLASLLVTRMKYGQMLGQSFDGDRKLYTVAGYPLTISYDQYQGRYDRDTIAKRIVAAYPDATWRMTPDVYETDKQTETAFEKAWIALVEKVNLYHYMNRLDKLAGIGRYGVMFLGLDDGKPPKEEPKGKNNLMYVQVYGEGVCQITKLDEDKKSPRYGQPLEYTITPRAEAENVNRTATTSTVAAGTVASFVAHWKRVIHFADNCLENDVYGHSRMENPWNHLQNLETMSAGSAEFFWRLGYPGLQFLVDKDASLPDKDALKNHIEEYIHGINRYMRLQNVEAKAIPAGSGGGSPSETFQMELAFVSAGTGIPVRILIGSERGELASSQDERGWHDRITERRDTTSRKLVKDTAQRFVELGVLPEPKEIKVTWQPIEEMNEKEKGEIANQKVNALDAYINKGLDALFTPMQFLTLIMGYTTEQAEEILKDAEAYQIELDKQLPPPEPPVQPQQPTPPGAVPPPVPGTKKTPGAGPAGKKTPPPPTAPGGPVAIPAPAARGRKEVAKAKAAVKTMDGTSEGAIKGWETRKGGGEENGGMPLAGLVNEASFMSRRLPEMVAKSTQYSDEHRTKMVERAEQAIKQIKKIDKSAMTTQDRADLDADLKTVEKGVAKLKSQIGTGIQFAPRDSIGAAFDSRAARQRKMGILSKAAADEEGDWRTINGVPVLIKKGQSVEDAIKERFGQGSDEHSDYKYFQKQKKEAKKAATKDPEKLASEMADLKTKLGEIQSKKEDLAKKYAESLKRSAELKARFDELATRNARLKNILKNNASDTDTKAALKEVNALIEELTKLEEACSKVK